MRPTDWTQIEIRDETALAGSSASRLVNILAHVLPVKYVIVGRAEGAGPDFAKIFKSEGFAPFSLDEFIRNAEVVTQFDWADFYLVREHDQLAGLGPMSPYPDLLAQALAIVRAVDDTYFYVYVRDETAADAVIAAYPHSLRKRGTIEDLEFPD